MADAIASATITRMTTYLRVLEELERDGVGMCNSERIADLANSTAFLVRRDLTQFGRFGTKGTGYSVPLLRREVQRILGLNRPWGVVLVGVGKLGETVLEDAWLPHYHFAVKALIDPDRVGERVAGLTVQGPDALPRVVLEKGIDLALLSVPSQRAQDAAQELVAAGIKGIINLTPTVLRVPKGIEVEDVNLIGGMKRLSFYVLNPHLREALEGK